MIRMLDFRPALSIMVATVYVRGGLKCRYNVPILSPSTKKNVKIGYILNEKYFGNIVLNNMLVKLILSVSPNFFSSITRKFLHAAHRTFLLHSTALEFPLWRQRLFLERKRKVLQPWD